MDGSTLAIQANIFSPFCTTLLLLSNNVVRLFASVASLPSFSVRRRCRLIKVVNYSKSTPTKSGTRVCERYSFSFLSFFF
jgi:hypothetical protein